MLSQAVTSDISVKDEAGGRRCERSTLDHWLDQALRRSDSTQAHMIMIVIELFYILRT